ncbi:hypothetical protein BH10PSE12_BH10PSE12_36060 [soil metagenome]
MMKPLFAAIPLALALSACATAVPPVEVTRFHAPNPATSGSIAVEEMQGNPDISLEFKTYAAAVGQELQRVGFNEVQGAGSDYQALVSFRRIFRPTGDGRPYKPVTVGGSVGGAIGGGGRGRGYGGSGVGLGIGIDLSGPPKDIVTTEMFVQIRRRSDSSAVWEGRAYTQAREGTPASQPGLAAAKLASALFGGYPGESGKTITVK